MKWNLFKQTRLNSSSCGILESDILCSEMLAYDITPIDGGFVVVIGDEKIGVKNAEECLNLIEIGCKELLQAVNQSWLKLSMCFKSFDRKENINNFDDINTENLLFLSNIKKIYALTKKFPDLNSVYKQIKDVFNVSFHDIGHDSIRSFNNLCLDILLLHRLMMSEIYRTHLIKKYIINNSDMKKNAQISGPWSNLDLPIRERVWDWKEDQEDFDNKQTEKREQTRYNPSYDPLGFYYVWQDLSLAPYRATVQDMQEDSPYKSNRSALIV